MLPNTKNSYIPEMNTGGGILQETIKSSFLFSFRTGNVVIDTFITGLVICISTYVMSLFSRLQTLNWNTLVCYFFPIETVQERKIVISSKSSSNQTAAGIKLPTSSYSPLFNAILHRIKKVDCDESEIVEMCEIRVQRPTLSQRQLARPGKRTPFSTFQTEDMEEESKNHTNLIVSQSADFKLDTGVFGSVKINNYAQKNPNKHENDQFVDQDDNGQQEGTKEFEITIKSQVLSMNELRSLVQTWVKEYLEYMEPNEELHYFQYLKDSWFSEFRFVSSKGFENLFFPEKEDLVNQIDYFIGNETWYKQKGLPYTLGFLFHGEPGCGKTSTIKAIANYTKRHIVSFSLKGIKNKRDLFNIFYQEYINDRKIPIRKRLYVLEDIDCSDLEDIVGDRTSKNRNNNSTPNDVRNPNLNISLALPATRNELTGTSFEFDKTKLTMADVLETLDGVMEMDGRMLVITTNYPEKLDAALTRPGRIDVQLNFDRCTASTLMDMYEHFYGCHKESMSCDNNNDRIWPENLGKESLPDGKWTPAEVTQILVRNIRSPINGFRELQGNPENK